MYKKILMLFLAFVISGVVFMSCSSDDDGGTAPAPTKYCTITSPNGGEILQMGDLVYIHFDSNLDGDVAMYLYKGGDSLSVINPLITVEDSVSWAIPTNLDEDFDYQIKIVSVDNPSISDFSDANFTIAPTGVYIMVTSSNGGDIWTKGSTNMITWYSNLTGTVRIDLYNYNAPYYIVYNLNANSGSVGWTIPADATLDAAADYTIQIQSIESPAVLDESDNFFAIAETEGVDIVGDWTVTFSKQPDVFYFNADGTFAADSLETNIGYGTWNMIGNGIRIDDDTTGNYLLGIVKTNRMDGGVVYDGAAVGNWDARRVTPDLLAPNGGEVWMHGTQDSIRWDAIDGNVVLSLADTTGIVQEIATVPGSDSLYVWTVPSNIDPGAAYYISCKRD